MTDAIRDAAIEAAARAMCKLDGKIASTMLESYSPPMTFPLWRQYEPAARAAIAAYERAMWRPEGESDADTDVIVWNDGEVAVAARHDGNWFQWKGRWLRSVTHFRPLPAPPEDAA